MIIGEFYSTLNTYYYSRKSLDYLEWKESKGTLSDDDVKQRVSEKKKCMGAENKLLKACTEHEGEIF